MALQYIQSFVVFFEVISIRKGLNCLQADLVALQYIQLFVVFFEDGKLLLLNGKRGKFNKRVGLIFF